MGLVAGGAASVTGPSKTTMELLGFPGEILLSMLRALVVPLIMSSIVVGITSLGTTTFAVLCLLLTTRTHARADLAWPGQGVQATWATSPCGRCSTTG